MAESLKFYKHILENHVGFDVAIFDLRPIGGGCINQARKLATSKGDFFVKSNPQANDAIFAKEAEGLQTLRNAHILSIPEVIGYGTAMEVPYLLMEFIKPGKTKPNYWEHFGAQLASLHQCTKPYYGFESNNYIGSLEQFNYPNTDWFTFFAEQRLLKQVTLGVAGQRIPSTLVKRIELFCNQLPELLTPDAPALLHGDLWSGNIMTDANGYACLIDPAVYYGHREIEIAFTQLFGGFEPGFYSAYFEAYPTQKGFEQRAEIYNLYPLLVHVNLFGGTYLAAIERILRKYV